MPGRMHPSQLPRYTQSPVEPRVFDAVRDALPDGWSAWHSHRFVYGHDRLHREIDFLILVPGRGLFLIEVKGGSDWHRADGHWYRGRTRVLDQNPLDQVLGANSSFRRMLEDELGRANVPPTFVMLCFPDMFSATRPGGSDLEGRVLLGGDLPHLDRVLRGIAEKAFNPNEERTFPWDRIEKAVHRTWGESWVPRLQLEQLQASRAKELVLLDAQQRLLARDTNVRGRLLVLGGPGSGKSLVAREAAARFVAEGRNTLFLCYTRALAIGMRREGVRDAHPVRDYAMKVLKDNEIALPHGPSTQWTSADWDAMMDAAAELITAADVRRPDVLVLDEAQDFGPKEWSVIDALAPDGTPVLAFGDPDQRILDHAVEISDRFHVELRLRTAYRTPEPLAELARSVRLGGALDAPESAHFHREPLAAEEGVLNGARRAVAWLLARHVAPADIAVLSLSSQKAMTRLPPGGALEGHRPAQADDPDASERLLMDNSVRFKGLERPWVVLIDTDHLSTEAERTRAYIGITRATMGLVAVTR